MMFQRKMYQTLLRWKEENRGKKAILIEGARRVGKTTVVKAFAENEYDSCMIIDFSKVTNTVKEYFRIHIGDLNTLFMLLQAEFGIQLVEKHSVIVFDEVQFCPKAREAIKHLVADGRYDYIETGSLISIRDNVKDILIPSEEHAVSMYPMDFEEFCMAMGNEPLIQYIRLCFKNRQPLERSLHYKAMLLYKEYLLVGGMPQSVAAFIDNNQSFEKADIEKRDILSLYRNDIGKIEGLYRSKVLAIFDQIPGLLAKHEKRVVLSSVAKGSSPEQFEYAFFWLDDSMISNECVKCTDPNIGFSLSEDRSYVKCYMGDTGLLVSHAFDENELLEEEIYKLILNDKLSINEGMLFENMVAQMLKANGHRLFYYTRYNPEKHRNDIEIDFLLSSGGKTKNMVIPIEVKSGARYQTKSLKRFKETYKNRIAQSYIIHPRNLSFKEDILCIPPYMVFCL